MNTKVIVAGIVMLISTQITTAQNKINSTGNVGIGTTNPSEKLDINEGNINIFGYNSSRFIRFTEANYIGAFINYDGSDNILNIGVHPQNDTNLANDLNSISIVRSNGNVGIGTKAPGNWKLAVNGNIRAKKVKVETGWADFVFYDNYKLPTLTEVENHINTKGHLKDIPSAKEVEANGVFLGEISSKLLQKIEELTLYTIAQEKSLKTQNNKIEAQQKEIETLKNLIQKLLNNKK